MTWFMSKYSFPRRRLWVPSDQRITRALDWRRYRWRSSRVSGCGNHRNDCAGDTDIFAGCVLGPAPPNRVFDAKLDAHVDVVVLAQDEVLVLFGPDVRVGVEGLRVHLDKVGHADDPVLCARRRRSQREAFPSPTYGGGRRAGCALGHPSFWGWGCWVWTRKLRAARRAPWVRRLLRIPRPACASDRGKTVRLLDAASWARRTWTPVLRWAAWDTHGGQIPVSSSPKQKQGMRAPPVLVFHELDIRLLAEEVAHVLIDIVCGWRVVHVVLHVDIFAAGAGEWCVETI
ncbi:hypothetical protein FA95DRAFT_1565784 [Auriscalpium vulgare]|uniref:Uncharacterized protein n=1 Tax=Auriscalpium vulgare TaxID=40419 RepID=A0ACB8RBW9_9AGAM|nr:hypothetical protein FA95DRAFT_1565784 [Auriscalpium vulgare]